jgi:mannose-1-phosphate guanylyltransferase/mannose-6-phosphate isomerase
MNPKVYPILLAGGAGKRLWPLSRKSYPKQFSKLASENTLFQDSALRLTSSNLIKFDKHITLTNSDFRFIISEQLQEVGIDPGHIIIEPESKNTAPAILASCLYCMQNDDDPILIIAPSDHVIPDTASFHAAIKCGLEHLKTGKIVTFGVSPTHPETGYGYLELEEERLDKNGTSSVKRFIEKPERLAAEKMLETNNYLWNAGIFLFRASDMISAFQNFLPETLEHANNAIIKGVKDLGFFRLNPENWALLDDISIDYAIMEKADNLVAVPYSSNWSDLGDWDAVWSESNKDHYGNVLSDEAHVIDCRNSILRSESKGQQIMGLGLDSIIAIAMSDAVLVADKNKSQEVKKVVEYLQIKNVSQADVFPKDYRPWGWFESLVIGDQFQVKRIYVKPGCSLSLQSHKFRSEHWIVVDGVAKVTIDNEIKSVSRGHSVYVPLGAIHRMANMEKEPMVLIEVQIGSYLGEDDIIRYEDEYNR